MINISLPDGSIKSFDGEVNSSQVIKSISEGLFRNAIAVEIDGILCDLNTVINNDCKFKVITYNDEPGKEIYRHTAAHILAQAIKTVYPNSLLAFGPAIKTGFYYDIEFKTPITMEDFVTIEQEMQRIIKADFPIERQLISKKEAIKMFSGFNELYKVELLSEISDDTVSVYRQGNFIDICRGPHLSSTGKIKAYKLTNLTGAYWKGDSHNKMLTRIYGTAFDKKSDLEAYLLQLEEAKKRDHNKLGREMGIFTTDENIGQGLPLLMPKGAKIIQLLQRFVEDEEQRRGYQITKTPYLAKSDIYKISGHWDHYRDGMFILGNPDDVNSEVYALRPMTCPFQIMIYKNGIKSYRDLPIRYNETSPQFRNENSGEMHGLIRVRQFTLSDGHLIIRPDQIEKEFMGVVDLIKYFLKCIGMDKDVTYRFSRWDPTNKEKYIDDIIAWEKTEGLMRSILNKMEINYIEAVGEAAFYGPKLDIQTVNVWGKEDTIITVQIDFALAERFDISYVDANGIKQRPYIIHRSSIGCYERTLALLIEKYNGALPIWLSPVQVKVLSLTDRTAEYASELVSELLYQGIRAEVDNRSEKIGFKIREAQLEKVPYMLILGDKEAENNVVAVRCRKNGDIGTMTKQDFIAMVNEKIKTFNLE